VAKVDVRTRGGGNAGSLDLDDQIFGIEPNVAVMHQVVTAQLAAARSGSQSTRTRAEVRGGGAKPYRQKGTGRARQGSIRSPQWRGGGVALGPKPRDYRQRTPKKMVRLALRSALSDRAADGKVVVVDEWGFDGPSTKHARQALEVLGVEGRILVVVERNDTDAIKSFRNLPEVHLLEPGELNAYDVLCSDWVVFTRAAVPTTSAVPGPAVGATPESPVTKAESTATVAEPVAPDAEADEEASE
jgi:large subunit ribosomal protein L4